MAVVKAVFWDFGGVITTSPFDAFAEMERRIGVKVGAVREVNALNPDTNAWARFERSELDRDGFCAAFELEANNLGYPIKGQDVLACLVGRPRPIMVRALERLKDRFTIACLTNNVAKMPRPPEIEAEVQRIMGLFDHIVESSKLGFRKPEERFYAYALERAGVKAEETIFLDDLGVNLKTARAMGMTTIKVGAPEPALRELGALVNMELLQGDG